MQNKKTTVIGLVLLAVSFVLVMVIVNQSLTGWRVDLTENNIYTVSDGTKRLLSGIDEPIKLRFYYSDEQSKGLPQIRTYANRVKELLQEYERLADGQISLEFIDPQPFSEAEDDAAAFGLQAVPVTASGQQTIYLGLVGTNVVDDVEVMPFLQPDQEARLEYDVSQLIYRLSRFDKPVLGLISELNMQGGLNPMTRQPIPTWFIYEQLQSSFELNVLDTEITEIPEKVKTLMVVHPKTLTENTLYAIDQFVMRGGRLLAFIDPHAQFDAQGSLGQLPPASTGFDTLLQAWGVHIDLGKIIVDPPNGLFVRAQNRQGQVRHPAMLGLDNRYFSESDIVLSELELINFATAGALSLVEGSTLEFTPLIMTSEQSQLVDKNNLQFLPDPSSLLDGLNQSSAAHTVAARLSGQTNSAFRDELPDATEHALHLSTSAAPANIVIVADTDLLADGLWVQVQNFFGQQLYEALANNGDFISNVVDNLSGSDELIGIASRQNFARPFDRVNALRLEAEIAFREKEQALQARLQKTEVELSKLQSQRENNASLVLTDEQKATIDNFLQEKLMIRKELRKVRHELNKNIDRLDMALKVVNIALMPIVIALFAFAFGLRRVRQRRALS